MWIISGTYSWNISSTSLSVIDQILSNDGSHSRYTIVAFSKHTNKYSLFKWAKEQHGLLDIWLWHLSAFRQGAYKIPFHRPWLLPWETQKFLVQVFNEHKVQTLDEAIEAKSYANEVYHCHRQAPFLVYYQRKRANLSNRTYSRLCAPPWLQSFRCIHDSGKRIRQFILSWTCYVDVTILLKPSKTVEGRSCLKREYSCGSGFHYQRVQMFLHKCRKKKNRQNGLEFFIGFCVWEDPRSNGKRATRCCQCFQGKLISVARMEQEECANRLRCAESESLFPTTTQHLQHYSSIASIGIGKWGFCAILWKTFTFVAIWGEDITTTTTYCHCNGTTAARKLLQDNDLKATMEIKHCSIFSAIKEKRLAIHKIMMIESVDRL